MANDPRLITIRRDSFPTGMEGDRMYYEVYNAFEKLNRLLSDTALVNLQDSIEYPNYTNDDDYSVLAADKNKLGILTGNSATKTFTLPSLGASNDKELYRFLNDSEYTLTITPGDSSSIWNSGNGYGIELPDRGTMVMLRYDYSRTKWDIINKTGGKVLIEGLVLAEPMNKLHGYSQDNTSVKIIKDSSGKRLGYARNNIIQYLETDSKFPPGCFYFSGIDEDLVYSDSPDWDIFGTQTGHKTVNFWVYENATGSTEDFIAQYEDGTNNWEIYKKSTEELRINFVSGGTTYIAAEGGTIPANTWTHIALIISGADVGIYINGAQVAYDGAWNIDTFSGPLHVGQNGGSGGYLAGRMQDLYISYNNPYNASPNVGLTDTFTVPAQPFQGVML